MILLGLSGHGHFDMGRLQRYHSGELEDLDFSEAEMDEALSRLPEAPSIA